MVLQRNGRWIQNTTFGTAEDIYVRAEANVDDAHPVANKGTLVIPGATAENGYVYLHTEAGAAAALAMLADEGDGAGDTPAAALAGTYLFQNLPTRYVEPRHGAIEGVAGDPDAGIEAVEPAETLSASLPTSIWPATRWRCWAAACWLPATRASTVCRTSIWQIGGAASDSVNSKAVSEQAAKGNAGLNFSNYADGNYPIRWTELTVQQMADASVTEVTGNQEPATVKATLDGKIMLAARGTNVAAAGTLDAAGTAAAGGTQGQYYVKRNSRCGFGAAPRTP